VTIQLQKKRDRRVRSIKRYFANTESESVTSTAMLLGSA
jgi:hypothetical protein